MSKTPKAIVIGAGVGGMATSIRLARMGYQTSVLEASDKVGGKMNEWRNEGFRFDMGPSLFTLPGLVDELFREAGKNPRDYFHYKQLPVICKYHYEDGLELNAFADPSDFAGEIEQKTGVSRERVLRFLSKSKKIYNLTHDIFLSSSLHEWKTYFKASSFKTLFGLHHLEWWRNMHAANQQYLQDPRLVQLFDRYATYNGSDPYRAPATLNVIPHLEHEIGAFIPEGGMYRVAESLYKLAVDCGVQFQMNTPVSRISFSDGRVNGVFSKGEYYKSRLVVSNMDVSPTYQRLLPDLKAPNWLLNQPKSTSAMIFYWGMKKVDRPLEVHNIFFSKDYRAEFNALENDSAIFEDPTIYVYISSKAFSEDAPAGFENWFVMVNAPLHQGQDWDEDANRVRESILSKLSRMLRLPNLKDHILFENRLDPQLIETRTSSFAGALYGNSSNTLLSAFLRHPNRSRRLKGLYFVGGSVHPGGGIPLCMQSAKIASDLIGKYE